VLQENILRSVGSGIVTMNMSAEITSWNNGAEQITGYRFDEVRDNWKEVFGDSIKGLFGQTDALKDRPVRFEGQIRKRDGSTAILGFTASLLKDDRNAIRGIILTFQDITRITEMEEQMRRQERLAMVGSLAAGIAHEIRNPLASLSGSIQMLQGDLDLAGDSKRLMDIVLRETERLNTIITEFLDYARPRSAIRERVDLGLLVQETVEILKHNRNICSGIDVRCDVASRLFVTGDAQRLRQVFWNLLNNAAQAITGDGVISVSAASGAGEQADHALVRVSDTGCGIPAQSLGNIFDPFFTTKSDGTGLGLAIAYRIIDDHGGSIGVQSESGRGSIFTIRLPLAEAHPSSHHDGADTAAVRTSA
jgi:two-component system sensor histidine kinase PilS (NtrC family)